MLAHVRAHVRSMRRLHAPDSCGMCGLARALLPLPRALPRWRTWHAQSRRAGAGLRRALQTIVAKTGISSAHVTFLPRCEWLALGQHNFLLRTGLFVLARHTPQPVCVCARARVRVRVLVCLCACVLMCLCVCVCASLCSAAPRCRNHAYARARMHVLVCAHVRPHARTRARARAHTHTYARAHTTRIHTHAHAHTHVRALRSHTRTDAYVRTGANEQGCSTTGRTRATTALTTSSRPSASRGASASAKNATRSTSLFVFVGERGMGDRDGPSAHQGLLLRLCMRL